MITCPVCNKELEDSASFCNDCGTKIVPLSTSSVCPSCGKSIENGAPFCTFCGADFEPKKPVLKAQKPKKKPFPTRLVVAGVALILVIALIFTLISCLFCGGNEDVNSVAYFKENELHLVDAGDVEDHWQVSEKLFSEEVFGSGDILEYTMMSTDGEKIFFPDKISYYSGGGFTLYWRDATDPDSEAQKIATDVREYFISNSGEMVIYSNGRDWYWHDLNEKSKIASDCRIMKFSEDLESVYFKGGNGITYRKVFGDEEKVKIDSDIASIKYISDDGETVYYTKTKDNDERSLYVKEGDEDQVKIADNINEIIEIYESGEIYYTTVNNTDEEAYTLHYYDGETSTNLNDEYTVLCVSSTETPMLIFSSHKNKEYDEENNRNVVDCSYFLVKENACTELDIDTVYNNKILLSEDEETIYYICNVTESYGEGDIYTASITDDGLEDIEHYDGDVSTMSEFLLFDDKVIYGKNYKEDSDTYELFADKESVSADVYSIQYHEDADIISVVTDYSNEKTSGTLNLLDGSELEKVYDDVCFGDNCIVVLDSGEIFFLADYNRDAYYGDLYFYDGGEAEFVDDEVGFLIPLNHDSKD